MKGLDNGAKMYCVDPRRTSSSKFADLWLGIDVGTDIALANAIAREIIHAGLANDEFIAHSTQGYDEFAASVEPYTLDVAAEITGVPAEAIREVAHAYATGGKSQILWTLGITEHHNAVDNVLVAVQPRPAHRSRRTVGFGSRSAPRPEQRAGRRRHGRACRTSCPDSRTSTTTPTAASSKRSTACRSTRHPGIHLTLMFEAMERGELTAAYVVGENPADSEADIDHARTLLERPRLPRRAGHLHDPHRRNGRRGVPGLGGVGRVGRHGHVVGATGAARARRGDAAGRGAPRHRHHDRARRADGRRPRHERARGAVGRTALAVAAARRHVVRAARRRRPPVAVPEPRPPGLAVPARLAVGGRPRWSRSGAVLGRRTRGPEGAAHRRVPAAPHDRPVARLVQHRGPVERLHLADPLRRGARHQPGRRCSRSASSTANGCGCRRHAVRSRWRCVSSPTSRSA